MVKPIEFLHNNSTEVSPSGEELIFKHESRQTVEKQLLPISTNSSKTTFIPTNIIDNYINSIVEELKSCEEKNDIESIYKIITKLRKKLKANLNSKKLKYFVSSSIFKYLIKCLNMTNSPLQILALECLNLFTTSKESKSLLRNIYVKVDLINNESHKSSKNLPYFSSSTSTKIPAASLDLEGDYSIEDCPLTSFDYLSYNISYNIKDEFSNPIPPLLSLININNTFKTIENSVWCLGVIAGENLVQRDFIIYSGGVEILLELFNHCILNYTSEMSKLENNFNNFTKKEFISLFNNLIWSLSQLCILPLNPKYNYNTVISCLFNFLQNNRIFPLNNINDVIEILNQILCGGEFYHFFVLENGYIKILIENYLSFPSLNNLYYDFCQNSKSILPSIIPIEDSEQLNNIILNILEIITALTLNNNSFCSALIELGIFDFIHSISLSFHQIPSLYLSPNHELQSTNPSLVLYLKNKEILNELVKISINLSLINPKNFFYFNNGEIILNFLFFSNQAMLENETYEEIRYNILIFFINLLPTENNLCIGEEVNIFIKFTELLVEKNFFNSIFQHLNFDSSLFYSYSYYNLKRISLVLTFFLQVLSLLLIIDKKYCIELINTLNKDTFYFLKEFITSYNLFFNDRQAFLACIPDNSSIKPEDTERIHQFYQEINFKFVLAIKFLINQN